MNDKNKGLLWGTLIGSIAGSITALLFAPKAGTELRQDITDGAKLVTEKSQDLATKITDQSSQLSAKVVEKTEGIIQEFRSIGKTKPVFLTVSSISSSEEEAKVEEAILAEIKKINERNNL
ncbi:YtxH domain-containing protein [Paenibacillus gallinarum]|uniref:YtxH domain-containing protein n=1 Tax=Paenibacillus gallinarum TaxID=2762232 RepID=A0ABR8SVC1_9BACL|nr:YtxH domain-containing protein [Paenibacillus gallinarum]MBD7967034.1 YtxH domain-containing protein [Paenibacillus gallinarum]